MVGLVSSMLPSYGPLAWSQPAPGPSVPGHQRIRRGRPSRAGRVLLRLGVFGPEFLNRVEDHPGQLDLLVLREQRRVTDEDIEQQPLVRLRAGPGERLAGGEVHRARER